LTSLLMCFRYLTVPMAHLPEVFGPLTLGLLAAYAFCFYRVFFAGLPIAPTSSPAQLQADT
jgi:hypothetical protein